MNKTRTLRFGVIAFVGLLLASCQGQSSASKTVLPLTTKNAQAAVAGRDYTTLYTVDPGSRANTTIALLAIREDGSGVIAKYPYIPPNLSQAQGQVGIQIGTKRTWFPKQSGAKPRGVFAAAAGGKAVVWGETKSTSFNLDWRMYAMTPGQKAAKLLGDSFDLIKTDDITMPPGVNWLTTDGKSAWWVMVYPPPKGTHDLAARIMVRDLAARTPLKIAVDHAMLPSSIARGLVYLRAKFVDPSMPSNRYEIRLLKNGVDSLITSGPLTKDELIFSMCASNTILAWEVGVVAAARPNPKLGPNGHLHVMMLPSKVQRIVSLDNSGLGLSLGCGTDFVAWASGSGDGDTTQYVMNVPRAKIWSLGPATWTGYVRVTGNFLAWLLPSKGGDAPWRVAKWHGV